MVKLAFAFIAAVVLCFCGSYAGNLLPEELDSLTDFKYGNLKDQRIEAVVKPLMRRMLNSKMITSKITMARKRSKVSSRFLINSVSLLKNTSFNAPSRVRYWYKILLLPLFSSMHFLDVLVWPGT